MLLTPAQLKRKSFESRRNSFFFFFFFFTHSSIMTSLSILPVVHINFIYEPVTVSLKLQALVYDILPLEEGAGKRCSECESLSHCLLPWLTQFSALYRHLLSRTVAGVSARLWIQVQGCHGRKKKRREKKKAAAWHRSPDCESKSRGLALGKLCLAQGLSPFLIGGMFVREPSWEYPANLVGS